MTHIECLTSHLKISLTLILHFPMVQHEKYLMEHLGVSVGAPNITLKSHLDVLKFIDQHNRSL